MSDKGLPMTTNTMAAVLAAHLLDCVMYIGTGQEYLCICGVRSSDHDVHQAEELAGAGFGLVVEFTNRQMQLAALMAYEAIKDSALAEAGAKALEEAAAGILTNDPLDFWAQHLPEGLGFQEAMSRWLKAHAAAVRGEG